MTIDDQLKLIKRGTAEIISEEELRLRLEDSAKTQKPLVVKAGFDPTAPDIHLGHTVLLRKLRHFQKCGHGHRVIFLIGDATALVGDPSGQSATRKMLTWDEVEANAKTYEKQVSKILNTNDKALYTLEYNSRWFSNAYWKRHSRSHFIPFCFENFVGLAQKYTVARLLERDDFQKRLKENKPISFLELFYPLMQGYDSVKIAETFGSCDVEIGGTDQKFNMLVGRDLQQAYGMKPQIVISMPLLEGTDGVNKMSKSLGNTIGINELPKEMFGKIMSISDALMLRYYELLTDEDVEAVKKTHPKEAKMKLGEILVTQYHGQEAAKKERGEFDRVFSQGDIPEDIPTEIIEEQDIIGTTSSENFVASQCTASAAMISLVQSARMKLPSGKSSKNEVLRQFKQGAVKIDGEKVVDPNMPLKLDKEYLFQVARRVFLRLIVKRNSRKF